MAETLITEKSGRELPRLFTINKDFDVGDRTGYLQPEVMVTNQAREQEAIRIGKKKEN